MTRYVSKSGLCFYSTAVHGELGTTGCTLPAADDLIEITDAQYTSFMADIAKGCKLSVGADGEITTVAQATPEEVARAAFTASRGTAVAAITVTTSAGNVFNGDEDSQNRMARSIVALTDTDTITWVLADNSTIQATKAELQEALKLSGEAQTALWVQTSTTS